MVDKELTTTKLIEIIFDNVLKSKFDSTDIYFKPEHVIHLFDTKFRPDYIVFRKNIGADETPLLVVEVKKPV